MAFYYVTNTNDNGETVLIGYNLTEEEKNTLFYSFKGGSSQDIHTGESNAYGCHIEKFKSKRKAVAELMTKPKEFNDALAVMEKYGFVVFPKRTKTVSYQQHCL